MPKEVYICQDCDYETDRRGKLDRHLESLKHQIKLHGITCCDLTYYEKHRYINHKRSEKHRLREKGLDLDQKDRSAEELKASAQGKLGSDLKKSLVLTPKEN